MNDPLENYDETSVSSFDFSGKRCYFTIIWMYFFPSKTTHITGASDFLRDNLKNSLVEIATEPIQQQKAKQKNTTINFWLMSSFTSFIRDILRMESLL